MKRHWVVVTLMLAAGVAAKEPWKLALDIKGNLSYLSKGWSDKDVAGKLAWSLAAEGTAEKQIGAKLNNKTVLKLAFGQAKEPDMAPEKSTDLIDLESVLKTTLGGWVDPFVAVRVVSKFADMSAPAADPYARYLNPATFSEALGAMRVLTKTETVVWDLRLGATAKQKVDRWSPANEWETVTTNDGGAELVTEVNAKLLKEQVSLKSTFRLYEAVFHGGADTLPNDWRYPDLNWQTLFSTTIAKYLMVGYTVELDYDYESDANIQHRHQVSLGVTLSGPKPKAAPVDTPPAAEPPAEE